MLTETDYNNLKSARLNIEHVSESTNRIPFETILSLLDFILIGIKAIFFDKMGKPKSKLQLIFGLPAIVRFVAEVIKRINGDLKKPNRVKALSNEQKAVKDITDSVNRSKQETQALIDLTRMGEPKKD